MNDGGEAAGRFKRPESVLVVVYTRTGKVLMLKRADHAEFWQSVTGSLEWGEESPLENARRELLEETGIAAPHLHDFQMTNRYVIFPEWRYKYAPGVTENTEHAFALELDDICPITINPVEHSEYIWMTFPQAVARATSWSNRDVIRAIGTQHGFI